MSKYAAAYMDVEAFLNECPNMQLHIRHTVTITHLVTTMRAHFECARARASTAACAAACAAEHQRAPPRFRA